MAVAARKAITGNLRARLKRFVKDIEYFHEASTHPMGDNGILLFHDQDPNNLFILRNRVYNLLNATINDGTIVVSGG